MVEKKSSVFGAKCANLRCTYDMRTNPAPENEHVMWVDAFHPISSLQPLLTQPMDPEKKSLNSIFPTKYVIPKSLKFSHWTSKPLSTRDENC